MYYQVIPTKIFHQSTNLSDNLLIYSSTKTILKGQIVLIPLGKNIVPGIIYNQVSLTQKPSYKIKSIENILDLPPIPQHLIDAAIWLSSYYLSPLPSVINLLLPKGITKNRRIKNISKPLNKYPPFSIKKTVPLNQFQKVALKELSSIPSHTKLLHGVTGSGKTNIYLSLVLEQFKKQRSSIILVPEISLTSQLIQQFQTYFHDSVIAIHSKQTESNRHQIWQHILKSSKPLIIIGARSAIFSPLQNLGLIIIDEAHDAAYYQENPPRYSALRLSSYIANTKNISCVYGTATPLIEDFYLAEKNHAYVSLTQKAKMVTSSPHIQLIDLKDSSAFSQNRYFSDPLIKNITQNLTKHQQTLIFHNRRGSAPLTICNHCGWQALCPNCLLPLTLHSDKFCLICHTCGHTEAVPKSCPNCSHPEIIHKGFGTKLLENELKKLFKTANIMRFDADSVTTESLNQFYNQIKNNTVDILIGTQLLAKGFDLPHLATVGIVQADNGLSLPDYSAEERSFQLLTQVIGRVGRGHLSDASVFVQTYQPDHPIIHFALENNYHAAYQYLIKKRQSTHFPPYYYLAKLYLTQKTEKTVIKKIRELYTILHSQNHLFLSAPTPAFHEFSTSGYTWQIILKSTSRQKIVSAIQSVKDFPNLRYILDPPSLL